MKVSENSTTTLHHPQFSLPAELKAQRLVAVNRLALSLAALLTAELVPATVAGLGPAPVFLLLAYFAYAVFMVVLVSLSHRPVPFGRVFSEATDFGMVVTVIALTHGVASPFFLLLPFLLFTTAVRGSRKSYQWLAVAVLLSFAVLGGLGWPSVPSETEKQHVIMRGVFLVLFAWLVARWRGYEGEQAKDIERLAEWPTSLTGQQDFLSALEATLAHAAAVVGAKRVLLFWQDERETSLRLADHRGRRTHFAQYGLPNVPSLVVEPLRTADFFCTRLNSSRPRVVLSGAERFRLWHGQPVDDVFRKRFNIRDLLSIHLHGTGFEGRVMFLGLRESTSDCLRLGQLAGRQIGALLSWLVVEWNVLKGEEFRVRRQIAADLHDGLLQSLAGITLALDQLHPALVGNLKALTQLDSIQEALTEEQRLLRLLILNPPARHSAESFDLSVHLHRMARRAANQFSARVDLAVEPSWPVLTAGLSREIFFLVHEAVLNSLRHSGATQVGVRLWTTPNGLLRIDVKDHGKGFDFRGRHSLQTLCEKGWAPKSLARRVAELNGSMTIESTPEGASLEIAIPVTASRASLGFERMMFGQRAVGETENGH